MWDLTAASFDHILLAEGPDDLKRDYIQGEINARKDAFKYWCFFNACSVLYFTYFFLHNFSYSWNNLVLFYLAPCGILMMVSIMAIMAMGVDMARTKYHAHIIFSRTETGKLKLERRDQYKNPFDI